MVSATRRAERQLQDFHIKAVDVKAGCYGPRPRNMQVHVMAGRILAVIKSQCKDGIFFADTLEDACEELFRRVKNTKDIGHAPGERWAVAICALDRLIGDHKLALGARENGDIKLAVIGFRKSRSNSRRRSRQQRYVTAGHRTV